MSGFNGIFYDTKVDVLALQVADDVVVTGGGVDMQGYEGVAFVAGVVEGAVYTGYKLKAQQATSSTFSDAADLADTEISFASITGIVKQVLDINKPTDRYVRPILTVPNVSATCVVTLTAIRYNPRSVPQSNSGEYHVSPSEGTA